MIVKEVAKMIDVHPNTLIAWAKRGEFKVLRDQNNYQWISMEEIEKIKLFKGTKICWKCKKRLSLENDFHKNTAICKKCLSKNDKRRTLDNPGYNSKKSKKYRQNNPDRVKEYNKQYSENNKDVLAKRDAKRYRENRKLRRDQWSCNKYGLTMEELENLRNQANGKCEICSDNRFLLHIDHDHKTGKVRGLLCPLCNHAIGSFRENIENFQNAANYLHKHSDGNISFLCRGLI